MTDLSADFEISSRRRIGSAVYQNKAVSRAGLSERLFALLFSGLVYPQIWEDPEVDMEAMALGDGHRVVTIASGGCNVLAYLTRSPARIDAVDLNASHVALNRLKLAAFRSLPGHGDILRFFGEAGNSHNRQAYRRFIAPALDARSRATGKAAIGSDAGASPPSSGISTTKDCSAFSSAADICSPAFTAPIRPTYCRRGHCVSSGTSSRSDWRRSSTSRCCAG